MYLLHHPNFPYFHRWELSENNPDSYFRFDEKNNKNTIFREIKNNMYFIIFFVKCISIFFIHIDENSTKSPPTMIRTHISNFTKKYISFPPEIKNKNLLFFSWNVFHFFFIDDNSPKAPPRRRDRSNRRSSPTGMLSHTSTISSSSTLSSEPAKPQPMSNGLPPTPKVHMGACFSKVYFECHSKAKNGKIVQ